MENKSEAVVSNGGMIEYTLHLMSMKRFGAKLEKTLAKIQALVDKETSALNDPGLEEYQQDILAGLQADISEDIGIARENVERTGVIPICTVAPFGVYFGKIPLAQIKAMIEAEPDKYYIAGSDGSRPNMVTLERIITEKENDNQ